LDKGADLPEGARPDVAGGFDSGFLLVSEEQPATSNNPTKTPRVRNVPFLSIAFSFVEGFLVFNT
jgi:hypothetical protein